MSRRTALSSPMALLLLFLAAVVSTRAQTEAAAEGAAAAAAAGGEAELVLYNVGYGIELTCDLPNPTKLDVVWKKNDTAVEAWWDVRGRYRLEDGGARLVLPPKTHEDDFGNYTCSVGGASRAWRVQGNPHSKLPANTNVVEGQKLKLQCRVVGKPYPAVTWLYENSTGGNLTDALAAFAPRAELATSDQGVEGGALLVAAAERTDAGRLVCRVNHNATFNGATVLRVKDMYAALWPFLGICAEVLVLCAVILIYERRRAKPELDDSDTDHHDAKKS